MYLKFIKIAECLSIELPDGIKFIYNPIEGIVSKVGSNPVNEFPRIKFTFSISIFYTPEIYNAIIDQMILHDQWYHKNH